MLDLQERLGNVARIEEFLAGLSAEGDYAAADNEAIVRAAARLATSRATEVLVQIVRRNGARHPGACADLLLRLVGPPGHAAAGLAEIGAALIDVLPGDPARPAELDTAGSNASRASRASSSTF